MRRKLGAAGCLLWFLSASLIAVQAGQGTATSPMRIEVQLVWGTNDKQSPDPKHKPVNAEVKKKLGDLPLKWANYFEVNRRIIELPPLGSQKVSMSPKCEIEIHDLGKSRIEVSHFSKGEHLLKRTQAFAKGDTFVLGGNAPNATSWFVVLKRLD